MGVYLPFLVITASVTQSHTLRVNLAGLFVLEPFISPSLFQRYPQAIDEWSLSIAMSNDSENGGLGRIEEHYKAFIVSRLRTDHRLLTRIFADRERYRRDCRGWSDLGPITYRILGN